MALSCIISEIKRVENDTVTATYAKYLVTAVIPAGTGEDSESGVVIPR